MKVLILSDDFPPFVVGGAGMVAYNHARQLVSKGVGVTVITTVQDKKDEGEIVINGITVYKIYSKYHERWRAYISLYNIQTVGKVKKIIKMINPDVVHAHNIHLYLSYQCLRLAKKNRIKVFLSVHDAMLVHYGKLTEFINESEQICGQKQDYRINFFQLMKSYKIRFNPFRNFLIKIFLKKVDRVFSVSKELMNGLIQNGVTNIEVIHNGIDVNDWRIDLKKVDAFKNKLEITDQKIILFGGRLSGWKGAEKIIRAMPIILEIVPDVKLLVIGRIDEYVEEMIFVAKELGVKDSIIFSGWVSGDELISAYHCSDVVVVPSLYLDPFPTINLEAMACSKPVVGTCLGGTKEVILDNETGFIVNPYDVYEMSSKIIKILTDSKLSKKYGEAGFTHVSNHFTLNNQIDHFINKYKQYLQ